MNVWKLFLLFEIALCAVVLLFVFASWRRKKRSIRKAHAPEHRLKIPNLWTETQHHKHSLTQMMRMKDGHFIMLSLRSDAAKVLVGPQVGSMESFTELASFPLSDAHKGRPGAIFNDLSKQLGCPQSETELREKVKELKPPR
jgi:hypothetical protein